MLETGPIVNENLLTSIAVRVGNRTFGADAGISVVKPVTLIGSREQIQNLNDITQPVEDSRRLTLHRAKKAVPFVGD